MTNTALQQARKRARMSQTDLARQIREAGFRVGDPNGCSREMIARWESGRVKCPQPRYLLLLENVLGQPATNLGFATDELGIDAAAAVADAGLGTAMPLPDPTSEYGPRTGIWRSDYSYYSSSRDATFTSRHYVMVIQRGARLTVRSLPASESAVSMDMSINGQVVTGTWTERTQDSGYYSGAVYYGAIQMLLDATERRMAGKWVGFGRNGEVNTNDWSLTLVDSEFDQAAVERWNREPE